MVSKIRKGDTVVVITGKSKGKSGVVLSVKDDRAVVEGVNQAKKSIKANPQKGIQGGFKDIFLPIHVSNIAVKVSDDEKSAKIGIKVLPTGEKKRYNKRTNKEVNNG